MQLTISKEDKAVYKGGYVYSGLSLTTIPDNVRILQFNTAENIGHIEFSQVIGQAPIQNESITALPNWANACLSAWDAADYAAKHPPAPTPEELLAACKAQATAYLAATDWSEVPSVSDTANTPHLLNKEEFLTYRNSVRNLVVTPTTEPNWPTVPSAQWSS
jgi:hypothetical protein